MCDEFRDAVLNKLAAPTKEPPSLGRRLNQVVSRITHSVRPLRRPWWRLSCVRCVLPLACDRHASASPLACAACLHAVRRVLAALLARALTLAFALSTLPSPHAMCILCTLVDALALAFALTLACALALALACALDLALALATSPSALAPALAPALALALAVYTVYAPSLKEGFFANTVRLECLLTTGTGEMTLSDLFDKLRMAGIE